MSKFYDDVESRDRVAPRDITGRTALAALPLTGKTGLFDLRRNDRERTRLPRGREDDDADAAGALPEADKKGA